MTEDDIRDRVEDMTTTTFSIAGVPIKVFKRFIAFCEENAKMTKIFKDKTGQKQIKEELCYSIALAHLLDGWESDAKNQMLFEKIKRVEERLSKLENGN